jgi:hypothetical protein
MDDEILVITTNVSNVDIYTNNILVNCTSSYKAKLLYVNYKNVIKECIIYAKKFEVPVFEVFSTEKTIDKCNIELINIIKLNNIRKKIIIVTLSTIIRNAFPNDLVIEPNDVQIYFKLKKIFPLKNIRHILNNKKCIIFTKSDNNFNFDLIKDTITFSTCDLVKYNPTFQCIFRYEKTLIDLIKYIGTKSYILLFKLLLHNLPCDDIEIIKALIQKNNNILLFHHNKSKNIELGNEFYKLLHSEELLERSIITNTKYFEIYTVCLIAIEMGIREIEIVNVDDKIVSYCLSEFSNIYSSIKIRKFGSEVIVKKEIVNKINFEIVKLNTDEKVFVMNRYLSMKLGHRVDSKKMIEDSIVKEISTSNEPTVELIDELNDVHNKKFKEEELNIFKKLNSNEPIIDETESKMELNNICAEKSNEPIVDETESRTELNNICTEKNNEKINNELYEKDVNENVSQIISNVTLKISQEDKNKTHIFRLKEIDCLENELVLPSYVDIEYRKENKISIEQNKIFLISNSKPEVENFLDNLSNYVSFQFFPAPDIDKRFNNINVNNIISDKFDLFNLNKNTLNELHKTCEVMFDYFQEHLNKCNDSPFLKLLTSNFKKSLSNYFYEQIIKRMYQLTKIYEYANDTYPDKTHVFILHPTYRLSEKVIRKTFKGSKYVCPQFSIDLGKTVLSTFKHGNFDLESIKTNISLFILEDSGFGKWSVNSKTVSELIKVSQNSSILTSTQQVCSFLDGYMCNIFVVKNTDVKYTNDELSDIFVFYKTIIEAINSFNFGDNKILNLSISLKMRIISESVFYIDIIKYIDKLVQANDFSYLVTINGYTYLENVAISYFTNLHRKIYMVYSINRSIDYENWGNIKYFVFSDNQKKIMIKSGINRNNILVSGSPYFEYYSNNEPVIDKSINELFSSKILPQEKKIITIATENFRRYEKEIELVSEIVNILLELPNVFVIISKHPAEKDDKYSKIFENKVLVENTPLYSYYENILYLKSNIEINETLLFTHVLITCQSNSLFHSLIKNIPVLTYVKYYDYMGEVTENFIDVGYCIPFTTSIDVKKILDHYEEISNNINYMEYAYNRKKSSSYIIDYITSDNYRSYIKKMFFPLIDDFLEITNFNELELFCKRDKEGLSLFIDTITMNTFENNLLLGDLITFVLELGIVKIKQNSYEIEIDSRTFDKFTRYGIVNKIFVTSSNEIILINSSLPCVIYTYDCIVSMYSWAFKSIQKIIKFRMLLSTNKYINIREHVLNIIRLDDSNILKNVYVFGTGESVLKFDFEKLKDKFVISCNGFPFGLDLVHINFTPNINVTLNPLDIILQFRNGIYVNRNIFEIFWGIGLLYDNKALIRKNIKNKQYINKYHELYKKDYVISINDLPTCELGLNYNNTKKKNYTELDCEKYLNYSGLMVNSLPQIMINLPLCLGCKNIYLCGFDMPKQSNHFYDSNTSSFFDLVENTKKTFNDLHPTQAYWDKYFFALSLMKYKAKLFGVTIKQLKSDSLIKVFDCLDDFE